MLRITETHDYDLIGTLLPATEAAAVDAAGPLACADQYQSESITCKMKCPICNRPVRLEDKEAPFCSERCREVDLGNWAMEKYVISTPADRVSQDEDED